MITWHLKTHLNWLPNLLLELSRLPTLRFEMKLSLKRRAKSESSLPCISSFTQSPIISLNDSISPSSFIFIVCNVVTLSSPNHIIHYHVMYFTSKREVHLMNERVCILVLLPFSNSCSSIIYWALTVSLIQLNNNNTCTNRWVINYLEYIL